MIFFDNELVEFQIRGEALLPPHVSPSDIEAAARDYWNAISTRHWISLEFEMRQRVIQYTMNYAATAWALKTAGIG